MAGAYRIVIDVFVPLGFGDLVLTLMHSKSVELKRPKKVYHAIPIELGDESLPLGKQNTARTSFIAYVAAETNSPEKPSFT